MLSIKDIIKKNIYDSFANAGLEITDLILILFSACIIGLYIYLIYKTFSKSAFYSKDLNITMAGISVVIAAIIAAMQANLIVSLGMVGALSIVRFRTAVKNPLDLLYLFWAVSAGIICGVRLYFLAILLSIIMTILLFILDRIPVNKAPVLLIVKTSSNFDASVIEKVLNKTSKKAKEVSVQIKNNEKEIIYEIISPDTNKIISKLNLIEDIFTINILEHNGEMRV